MSKPKRTLASPRLCDRQSRAFAGGIATTPTLTNLRSPWTTEDDAHLEYLLFDMCLSNYVSAIIMGRTEEAIKKRRAVRGWDRIKPDPSRVTKAYEALGKLARSHALTRAKASLKAEIEAARREQLKDPKPYKPGSLEW